MIRHTWICLSPFTVLVVLLFAPAGGWNKPPTAQPVAVDDVLRTALVEKGYIPVTLVQADAGGFTVECKSGDETWLMLLDTGAEASSLDIGLVKKLGLEQQGEVTGVGIGGIQNGIEVSLRALSIGKFDSRSVTNVVSIKAFDFTVINTSRDERKLPRVNGLLGHSALRSGSAVIDYSTRTLYLRRPLDALWPEVEGKWVAAGGQDDGRDVKIDPQVPPRLEFKDRLFGLTYGGKLYRFGMHVSPGKDRYTLACFDPGQEFAKELEYKAGGLLKVAGDKLTVCLVLDRAAAKAMPADFTAPAGSGHVLLEFRRDK